jgi:hypothetical protein
VGRGDAGAHVLLDHAVDDGVGLARLLQPAAAVDLRGKGVEVQVEV